MHLVHSTSKANLTQISIEGLLLKCATPVVGMEERAIWFFDFNNPTAKDRYHRDANILIEVDISSLTPNLLREYYSIPEQMRRPGDMPNAYMYIGNILPEMLRVLGHSEWGDLNLNTPNNSVARIFKWLIAAR